MFDVHRIRHTSSIASWVFFVGGVGYFAYHFVLVGHQYARVIFSF